VTAAGDVLQEHRAASGGILERIFPEATGFISVPRFVLNATLYRIKPLALLKLFEKKSVTVFS
jgi:hypothetical protein